MEYLLMLRTLIAGAAVILLTPVAAHAEAANKPVAGAGLEGEFTSYDADKSGQLDQSEFSSWFLAKAQKQLAASGKTATQEQLSSAVTTAFAAADADKNQTVSKDELTRYLAG
jgi:Ca2+-binding EF-hand superfamily protein